MDRQHRRLSVLIGFLLLVVTVGSGCEPAATPVAAVQTSTPLAAAVAAEASALPALRYGVTVDLQHDLPEAYRVQTIDLANEISGFDVLVTYGVDPTWSLSDGRHTVWLVTNPTQAPFDNPQVREQVLAALDPNAVVDALPYEGITSSGNATLDPLTTRVNLANLGYPDGFALRILAATTTPGLTALRAQLDTLRLPSQVVAPHEANENFHFAYLLTTSETEHALIEMRYPGTHWQAFFSLPIRYRFTPGLIITFDDAGIPLATRRTEPGS